MKRYRDYTEQSSASKEHMKKVAKMAEYDSMDAIGGVLEQIK